MRNRDRQDRGVKRDWRARIARWRRRNIVSNDPYYAWADRRLNAIEEGRRYRATLDATPARSVALDVGLLAAATEKVRTYVS